MPSGEGDRRGRRVCVVDCVAIIEADSEIVGDPEIELVASPEMVGC